MPIPDRYSPVAVATTALWLLAFSLPSSTATAQQPAPSEAATSVAGIAAAGEGRTRSGLLALYDFAAADGPVIHDRAGAESPVNLRIADPKAVRRTAGALQITGPAVIRSDQPATRINESIRRTGEFTIEVWLHPARTNQTGPARIVTLSQDPNQRNFTLGQDGDRIDARFRTTKTNANGIPSLASPSRSLQTRLTHIVYTRERSGRARLYIDGKQAAESSVAGDVSNWNRGYVLAFGNELSGDRPWQGSLHLVAIYSRALPTADVERNFRVGAEPLASPVMAQQRHARHFETEIAPLIARHCLECHDASTKQGGLDLSQRSTALAGGENGAAIQPGKSAASLLWEMVESDAMPADREPLPADEKRRLRQWIDDGAAWSLDTIDPAVYAHDNPAAGNWVRRLTVAEYIETVRSTLGVDIEKEARELLPPDLRADGFTNTAYNLNVDLKHVDAYAHLAEIVVGRMDVAAFARRFSSSRKLTDDSMRGLIAKMGPWVLRGPLEEHEIVALRGVSTTVASAGGGYDEAVAYTLQAMLQSPRFVYRIERQRGDGSAWPVDNYELASRLSYILWGAPPDEELYRAAERGELDRGGIRKQTARMLRDPRAVARSVQFVDEWLNLARLANLRPNPDKFPNWDARLAADMRDETRAFFEDVVWRQQRPLVDLLNAQVTFATPRLARHYGLPPAGQGLARYDLNEVPERGGLLTHGSVLTVGGDEASMVSRGLFVLHDFLRGVVKDPPPCVDTTPVATKAGLTQRAIAESRIANKNCGGCHARFEPLAFGLEQFDGLGAFHRRDEHGNPLRDDGQILFPGSAGAVSYQSAAELMDLLADCDRVAQTITWKLAQFALGRPLGAADAATVQQIHELAQQDGGTYAALINAIVTSDLVLTTRTEPTR